MKTEWDYTELAKAYLKRPDYSEQAINQMLSLAGCVEGSTVCDVGAGVAHLTLMLLTRKLLVVSVEPNDEMRKYGVMRTKGMEGSEWFEGTGEDTGQENSVFDLVTFGSSFNVTNRQVALRETKRIGKDKAWFAAMWNHRDLDDPVQKEIEGIIKAAIPEYGYGTRREDQTAEINESGLFGPVHKIEGGVMHSQNVIEMVEAWRSHATLQRQAGDKFHDIIDDIEKMLISLDKDEINIPYTTRIWAAQLK